MVPTYHDPVLLHECLHWLDPKPGNLMIDGTLGDGGHTRAMLESEPRLRVIGFDADPQAIERASARLLSFGGRFRAVERNVKDLAVELHDLGISTINGLLLDLGVSSAQLDDPAKGFTYRDEAPLKMQFGPSSETTASEVVNSMSEKELADIFYRLGEEKNSRRIARAVVEHRSLSAIKTTAELSRIVSGVIPERHAKKTLSRIFQAIRIHVNNELVNLTRVLQDALELMEPGGRIVVISYHSLEDRIVKDFFKREASNQVVNEANPDLSVPKTPRLEILTKKPVPPTDREIEKNPRARSAKLRAARKL